MTKSFFEVIKLLLNNLSFSVSQFILEGLQPISVNYCMAVLSYINQRVKGNVLLVFDGFFMHATDFNHH